MWSGTPGEDEGRRSKQGGGLRDRSGEVAHKHPPESGSACEWTVKRISKYTVY